MRDVNSAFMIITAVIAVSITTACNRPAQMPVGQSDIQTITGDNSTSVPKVSSKPDRVELIYFHTKNPCHCMSVVKDNIIYAVDTYFKDEVASGKVKLTTIVSDDPANAELVKKYDAMLFTLFIRETRGTSERIYPVSAIWNLTGDDNKDRLVNFIKITLNNILAGKS